MITARIAVASALLAGVSWVVWRLLDDLLGTLAARADRQRRAAPGWRALFVYMRAVLAMHVPEAHQVSRLIGVRARTRLTRAARRTRAAAENSA